MSILKNVEKALQGSAGQKEYDLAGALADAEKLADQYSDIQPVPYVVPIERFAGLPILGESEIKS